jgi:2-polyprenyl-6-hydroxyphenyl methylase/3-demethylubiquinone-9 3-methyltransferase
MTVNIDPEEITKFDADYYDWHNSKGKFRSLHAINSTRMHFITHNVNALAGKKVLDIGCGGGILSYKLAQLRAIVEGIDKSSSAISAAQQHARLNKLNIHYSCNSVEDILHQRQNFYDLICCLEVVEHVPSPRQLIIDAISLLKPGGHIVVATINRNLYSFIVAILGAEYIFRILPINTHHYNKLVKPQELSSYLSDANAKVISTSGMFYNPLTHNACLVNNMWVNYILCAQKI